jgi:hypothetical protein
VKDDPVSTAASIPAAAKAETNPNVRLRLEKGIAELQGLHELLLSTQIDADVLADLRDALNRVRNTAWVAQQYVLRKEIGPESTSVPSLLAGERIRATYQLCRALSDDLTKPEIELPRGSLLELQEATKTLREKLKKRCQ